MDQHEIVQDVKRVAVDLGRTPNYSEYLSHGQFSERKFRRYFGSYRMLLVAAGLKAANPEKDKPIPEVRAFQKEIARYDNRLERARKFEEEILPWVGKYERDHDDLVMMMRSDDHAQWVDPYCDDTFWAVAERIQPKIIVFGGDTNDFYKVSSHGQNPRKQMSLQSEINFVVEHFWKRARSICPNAQIDWLLGNHEWRLFNYICNTAPALSSLECLDFSELFKLKQYEINLVARKTFVTAKHEKDLENFKIYNEKYVITHGTSTGKHPADTELARFGLSGCSGHVHRHTVARVRNLHGNLTWHTNGAMCSLKSGEEYISDFVNWDQGFNIAHVSKTGNVYQEYVDLSTGMACVGGVYYRTSQKA